MSSLSEIEVYRNENNPIWLAEAKWYDHKVWISLISSVFKNLGREKLNLDIYKPQKAVPLADPTIFKELGVQQISCNIGSTELLPYHVLVFKAARVYYGDVLEMTDPRGFIQMAFLISLEGTKKYPTLTADMVQMMSNLRKYALTPFLTPLSELVFPPMSNRVYDYKDVASNKEIGAALKMIKKDYPEMFSAIALINHVSINGVDDREAYPRVLMYDKTLENLINTVAEGDKGFEILEFSPHFRRRGAPRRDMVDSKKEQGGPSKKKQKKVGDIKKEASYTDEVFQGNMEKNVERMEILKELEEKVKLQGTLAATLEKRITDQAKLIDDLTLRLEKQDEIIKIMQAQAPSNAAVKKNKKPLGSDDETDEDESSGFLQVEKRKKPKWYR